MFSLYMGHKCRVRLFLRHPVYEVLFVMAHTPIYALGLFKGTNPPLKKSLNIPEIYAKMFSRLY